MVHGAARKPVGRFEVGGIDEQAEGSAFVLGKGKINVVDAVRKQRVLSAKKEEMIVKESKVLLAAKRGRVKRQLVNVLAVFGRDKGQRYVEKGLAIAAKAQDNGRRAEAPWQMQSEGNDSAKRERTHIGCVLSRNRFLDAGQSRAVIVTVKRR